MLGLLQAGQVKRARHAQRVRMAAIVQRQPAPGRVDQVDAAPGTAFMDQVVKCQAPFAVAGQDLRRLRIVTDKIDQHRLVAQRQQSERHPVTGMGNVIDHGRNVDRVGHGQWQRRHPHNGVDPHATGHQHGYHASTADVMAGNCSGAVRSTASPVSTLVPARAPLMTPAKRDRSSVLGPAFLFSTTITVCLPSCRK